MRRRVDGTGRPHCPLQSQLAWLWRQVSDDGLRALADLTALTYLNLGYCGQVSDDGLLALVSLTGLTNLNLGGCSQVSNDGSHALGRLTALATLNLLVRL